MTRLIDADALMDKVADLYTEGEEATEGDKVINNVIDIINNAPTASPKEICIANIHFDKEQLQEIVDEAIADYQIEPIRCKDCKHQKKFWHEDKRMKDKGYWVYSCELISDPFIGTPVWGLPDQYCSSAERRESKDVSKCQ